jgi:hypothetical protein
LSKIAKKTASWVKAGIFNSAIEKKILDYETTQNTKPWVVWGFLALGILVIGVGIISIIAANVSFIVQTWLELPPMAKLTIDFMLMLPLTMAAFNMWREKRTMAFEALLLAIAIGALASIGLISQVYNSGGQLYQALLFWCLITAGLPHLSERKIISALWGSALLGSIMYALFVIADNHHYLRGGHDSVGIVLSEPIIAGLLTVFFRSLVKDQPITRVFQTLTMLSFLFFLIAIEFGLAREFGRSGEASTSLSYFGGLALILGLSLLVNREYSKTQRVLLMAGLGSFVAASFVGLGTDNDQLVIRASMTIVTLVFAALYCAARNQAGGFQWLLSLIGIRFLILYFQALGGLAATGFGLIISGVIIVGAVMLWNRYRHAIARWAQGVLQ